MMETTDNRKTLEQLKQAADDLRAGRSEEDLRSALLDGGLSEEYADEYIDIAIQYNDLTYRRTGLKFFVVGLVFLVAAMLLMLLRLWQPILVWPHYVMIGCVSAGGVNLLLGVWRTIIHKDPRAEEAARRRKERHPELDLS